MKLKRRSRIALILAVSSMLVILPWAHVAEAASTFQLRAIPFTWGFPDTGVAYYCGGSATMSPTANQQKMLVSYNCQYQRKGTTTWTNLFTAPSKSCTNCSGTVVGVLGWGSGTYGCERAPITGADYLIRANVDGYWIDNVGVRHDVASIQSAPFEVDCASNGPAPVATLKAIITSNGSTAGSGPTVWCGGANFMNPVKRVAAMVVSYVCQKNKVGTTTWTSVGTAPQKGSDNSTGSSYWETSINCSTLGAGTWNVRPRVDGYWYPFGGSRTEMNAITGSAIQVPC